MKIQRYSSHKLNTVLGVYKFDSVFLLVVGWAVFGYYWQHSTCRCQCHSKEWRTEEQSNDSISSRSVDGVNSLWMIFYGFSFRVIKSLGRFQTNFNLSVLNNNGSKVFTRKRFAMQIRDIYIETFRGEIFSVDLGSKENRNTSNIPVEALQIHNTVDILANTTASITIPPDFLTHLQPGVNQSMGSQRLSYSVFLTDILFQSPNQSIGTVIIALRLKNLTPNGTASLLVNNTFRLSEVIIVTAIVYRL